MDINILNFEEHPMYPAFLQISMLMGHAANHPEDEKAAERLEEMNDLARMTYQTLFANQRTREEFALFIAVMMTIYHEQFLERDNATKETKNAPTVVKRNSKRR